MNISTGRKVVKQVIVLLLCLSIPVWAQLPAGFIVNKLTGNTINEAVAMAHAPDGRIFMAERSGNLKVYKDGTVSTVHTVSTTTAVEQGLLGIALHSDFANNGKCYLYYTNPASTLHYLDMIVIDATNDVTSETRIMEFDPILNGFHNGGAMLFKDNHLYVCIGESNIPAQSAMLDTYRGKVLRLLEDGQPAPGNPYYNEVGANRQKKSIWAIGMRNPWYMTMDPVTQKLYVINVGGNYEEVDDITAPDPAKNYNYGWAGDGKSGPEQPNTTIYPAYAYGHAGWGCAITSGVAFHPSGFSTYPNSYRNKLYFTDWCSGWLRSFDMSNPAAPYEEFSNADFGNVLALSTGIDGNIYYFKYGTTGSLNRLEYTLLTVPIIVNHPTSQTVYAQDEVRFSVVVSGAATLTYQWYRNNVAIANATSATYTIATSDVDSAGTYHCVITNGFGSATSNNATLTVKPYNAKPIANILNPAGTVTWNVQDVINFSGTATDAEDGTLAAAAYTWEVQLFHKDCPSCEHWHPGPAAPSGVTSGSFIAENGGESSSNIWVRLILKVTDSEGRVGRDSVDLHPNKVSLTLQSNKAGLSLALGTSQAAPFTKVQVVNSLVTISAPPTQLIGDSLFTFVSWNIGGAATQTITVPNANTTYIATYTSEYLGQRPYGGTAHPVPGTVQAENYDEGGANVAYYDNSNGNAGNQYRTTENVDLENCNEGGFNVAYVAANEWLEYTVDVANHGIYTMSLRAATPNNTRAVHFDVDGTPITGSIAIPNTGAYQNWQTVTIPNIELTEGIHVLRLTFEAANMNVSYIQFDLVSIISSTTNASKYESRFQVFPNPTENMVQLKSLRTLHAPYRITLQNAQGQEEWTKIVFANNDFITESVDLSEKTAGLYFLKIQSGDFVQTIKVVRK